VHAKNLIFSILDVGCFHTTPKDTRWFSSIKSTYRSMKLILLLHVNIFIFDNMRSNQGRLRTSITTLSLYSAYITTIGHILYL